MHTAIMTSKGQMTAKSISSSTTGGNRGSGNDQRCQGTEATPGEG